MPAATTAATPGATPGATVEGQGGRPLAVARRALAKELGSATIARRHKASPLQDAIVLVGWPALTATLVWAAGTLPPFRPAWAACVVAQGIVLTWYLEVGHDLFLHRRLGGRRLSSVLGFLYLLPIFYSYTGFIAYHLGHHRNVNLPDDPERPIRDVDARWKRLLFLTYPGFKLALQGRFKTPRTQVDLKMKPEAAARVSRERWIIRGVMLAVAVGAVFSRFVLFGYVLPFVLVSPVVNVLRILLEHGEADPQNLYFPGTYYRTGWLIGWFFPGGPGDRHVVHHLFPAIPMYRLGEAARLIRPFMVEHGVRERRSIAALLVGYFVRGQPHGELWNAHR